ncbi:MAG: hypothetical protein EPN76_06295 [Burkholderiaceae bacterium]|nr:MAG: hypothetical protein EPN76_06295 [Burkholderiaceae bacterium]
MVLKLFATLLALTLGGCAGLPDWSLFAPAHRQEIGTRVPGTFSFAWRLSGDPEIAPLQVFDNGVRMWLQFAAEQAVPAIFARTPEGDRVVDYQREGPYIVVGRVWPHLLLRGGSLESRIDRVGDVGEPTFPRPGVGAVVSDDPVQLHENEASSGYRPPQVVTGPATSFGVEAGRSRPEVSVRPQEGALSGVQPSSMVVSSQTVSATQQPKSSLGAPSSSGSVALGVPSSSGEGNSPDARPLPAGVLPLKVSLPEASVDLAAAVPNGSVAAIYSVGPEDRNMRLALSRWADSAGWTFDAEHWSVDVDIPLAGSAQFQSGFKEAVQALMAATELADRPLQPCFYSNKVLRIVPYAQPCNRVALLSGDS